jgi:hypothetical protein
VGEEREKEIGGYEREREGRENIT